MRKIAAAIVMPPRYPAPLGNKPHSISLAARAPVGGAIGVALASHDNRRAAADTGAAGAAVYGPWPAPGRCGLSHQAARGGKHALQLLVGEPADRLKRVDAGRKAGLA